MAVIPSPPLSPSPACIACMQWFRNNFPYYKTTVGTQWQNSLRHSLSLNGNFFLVEQDRGASKGGLWALTPDAAVYLEDRMKKYRGGWVRGRCSSSALRDACCLARAMFGWMLTFALSLPRPRRGADVEAPAASRPPAAAAVRPAPCWRLRPKAVGNPWAGARVDGLETSTVSAEEGLVDLAC